MSWLHAARTRARLLLARRDAESRMDEEFGLHLDMEAERLVREDGLEPREARRRAAIAFGLAERHKDQMRDGRGLAWLSGLTLDLKLGGRMLVKFPGLTIVGGLAMAFAIFAGTVIFEVVGLFVNPTLPLPGGDRIVQVQNFDVAENETEARSLTDFLVWRESLRSVTDMGAFRDVTLNLIGSDRESRPVQVAEINATAFRIAPTQPLLGRILLASDERADAPPVVLLGHEVWRTRFASDRGVLGQNVQLGGRYATVVGVMPEGYAFPVSHEAWTPLRIDELHRAPREGPGITVFGRLAPGASLEKAQAELTTLGRRAAAEMPRTHEHLQPRVTQFAQLLGGGAGDDQPIFLLIDVFAVMLLVLVCGNVAMLLFARAASRESELVVRSALGASRGRIVTQLFAEALVLGGLAAAVGLAASTFALDRWGTKFLTINMGKLPFWFDPRLSPSTVVFALLLTLLAAVITGVVPGLKITRGMASRLKVGTAGGGGVRFGGVWTAVIVTQVAFTVFFPSIGLLMQKEYAQVQTSDPGFAAEEFLAVELDTNSPSEVGTGFVADTAAYRARFAAAVEALGQRVATEPGVEGVTFVDRLPRESHRARWAELDAEPGVAAASATQGRWVDIASIDPSYFQVLEVPILSGRAFNAADLAPGSRSVIVDQGFIDQMMQGRNPIGRRIRLATSRVPDTTTTVAAPLPWYEIVGVVKELGMGTPVSGENMQKKRPLGVYLPAAPGTAGPLNMMVHVRGDPMSLVPTVRTMAAQVDPSLRLSNLQRVDEVNNSLLWVLRLWMRMTAVLTAIAIVLSLAGIYAVLSYTVARRTREIGVRVALGASRGRVVVATFRQPLIQVALGVMAGSVLIVAGSMLVLERTFSPLNVVQLVAYAVLMLGVCLLACIVPTRRALGVEPTVALRAE